MNMCLQPSGYAQRLRSLLLCAFFLCAWPWAGWAADAPAEPVPAPEPVAPEYESPEATLKTFFAGMKKLADNPQDETQWARVFGTLDLPPGLGEARREVAWKLLGVFNHLGRIDPVRMSPGLKKIEKTTDPEKRERFEFFPNNPYRAAKALNNKAIRDLKGTHPPGSIVLARTEGGAWRFTEQTLDDINLLYSWIEPRGLKHGADIARLSVSEWLRSQMPDSFKGHFLLGIEGWQWAGLVLALFLVVVLDQIARFLLRGLVRRMVRAIVAEPTDEMVRFAVRPMGLAIAAYVFRWLLEPLGLTGMVATTLTVAATLVLAAGAVWAAWAVSDVIMGAWLARARASENSFDDMVVPLISKTIKLFIILVGLVYIADSLDVLKYFAPLIAGFGVAGLAISFAAQDLVKNLFGGLAIFMDRPFKIGDRVVVNGVDGIIDQIGFRVTRLRTLAGHLVSMPNSHFTNEPIENISSRPTLRRIMNLTITYDTPREKIDQAVQIVRDIMEEDGIREPIHPTVGRDYLPPRVFFNDFNADSLNIFCIYWYVPTDWWAYNEHGQRLNLRIFEEFEKAGIEFAFPTQTLFLAGDPKRELTLRMMSSDMGTPPH